MEGEVVGLSQDPKFLGRLMQFFSNIFCLRYSLEGHPKTQPVISRYDVSSVDRKGPLCANKCVLKNVCPRSIVMLAIPALLSSVISLTLVASIKYENTLKTHTVHLVQHEINLFMSEDYTNRLQPKASSISAHVNILSDCQEEHDPIFKQDVRNVLKLTQADSNRNHVRGVKFTEDGLIIQRSGIYFVYSNLNFKPCSKKSTSEFTYQTWFHYVHREHNNNPMKSGVLLRSVYTSCSNCTGVESTSYSGGLFHLEPGDLIQVSLTGRGLLGMNGTSSDLGLYLLADK
ncbi:uncharacterized protein LOC131948332 [Physella acuta]|uniref:uncharacterized protein LOC131948332 n=1 Tax=Physella acuta TaxID=109671 RepID=UPI0027DCFF74|nr:uncharacterized protein LOC131948332 [Physella acuta]